MDKIFLKNVFTSGEAALQTLRQKVYGEKFYHLGPKRDEDLIVPRGSKIEYCAGSLAAIFEKLGGNVIYFGKPYPEIYNFCMKKNESILAIGDNIRTDIKGANKMKFDSLFITGGIHKIEFTNLSVQNYDKGLSEYKTKTNYYQQRLIW